MSNTKNKVSLPGGVEATQKEVQEAKKEGTLEYVKEGAKAAMTADTGTTADSEDIAKAVEHRVAPDLNTTFIAPLLDLGLDAFVQRLTNDKVEGFVDLEVAKGLLALERAGQNRTDYVKALCKRIGVKSPYEVTDAGPGFTNDISNITEL